VKDGFDLIACVGFCLVFVYFILFFVWFFWGGAAEKRDTLLKLNDD
jgi:hypothetical protein